MVNEMDLRRSEFQPGIPVVLGDGQSWHFPRICLRWKVILDPETRRPKSIREYPQEAPTYAEALDLLDEGEAPDYLSSVADLALQLLNRNYEIPDDLVPQLFWHDPDSEASSARLRQLNLVIRGLLQPPKPEPAG